MRKLSKKISMLMVLAMLVGMFSGVVSASAASSWSFKSKKYNVAVDGTVVMGNKEYADFDLLKDGKAPTGYTVTWASSDENVVWVNAKTGQLRANKLGMANVGDKAVISATFTNTATKKSATRSFVIAYGEQEYELVTKVGDVVLGEETLLVGESYKLATTVLDEAGNSVDFKTCKLYRNYFIDGKAIANPYVPEKAGKVTIVVGAFAKKADMDDLSNAKFIEEFDVEATTGEFAAEADSIYTFKVTGKFAKDADFKVVKNETQKVTVKSVAVAEDGASAVITLTNKLTKGIYTITCDDQEAEVDVDDERAEKIVIYESDDVVYTGKSNPLSTLTDLVYVHYDVYNQYGDSIRKSTTIEWSYNADSHEDDKTLGILTLKENSGFRFGDLIVLNGVALNNGQKPINVTSSMKVNLEQAASKIEIIGVVKNDSNVLLQEVPANFVGGEYSLVFKMRDRKDYPMHYDADMAKKDFSFVSMDPLLIADIVDGTVGDFGTVYIDGTAYGKLAIAPGIQSKFGGYAEIKAISNKTGIESPKEIRVVSDQIVQSFEIQTPDNIVARNAADSSATNIKLDYIALDEEGDKITDFRALYKAISFSSRDFVMKENNDGVAELWYTVDVSTIKPEKSYDAAAIVTTILYTGSGNAATKQLNIKLDRIASETGKYNGDEDVLEGGSIQVKIADNLKFLDQYGDELKSSNLFRSTKDVITGTNDINYAGGSLFEHRLLGVRVKKAAATAYDLTDFRITGTNTMAPGYTGTDYIFFDPVAGGSTITLTAGKNFTEGVEEFPVEFVLYDAIKKEFVGGSSKVVTFKVHDLSQVVEFSVDVSDKYSKDANDDAVVAKDLKGTLRNGKKVSVPVGLATSGTAVAVVKYVLRDYDFKLEASTVTGGPVLEPSSTLTYGVVSGSYSTTVQKLPEKNSILGDANVDNWLLYKDQSLHTVDGWFKDRNLVYDITVDVYKDDANIDGSDQFRGTAKATTDFGNVERKYVSFDYVDDYKINGKNLWIKKGTEAYVHATDGDISSELLRKYITGVKDNYGDAKGTYMTADDTVTMTITKAVEGGKGLVEDGKYTKPEHLTHMLTVNLAETTISDANLYMITGAEIGDTFYVTYTVKGHPVTTTVKFTVGSDIKAEFSDYNDKCDYR